MLRSGMTLTVAVVAFAAVACGGLSERAGERLAEEVISRSAGENVDIDVDGETLTVETDEGTARFGGASLPGEFPSQMPVPDGLTVMSSFVTEGSGGTVVQVQLMVEDDELDRVAAFFDERLASAGWTVEDRSSMDLSGMRAEVFGVSGHGFDGAVTVQMFGEGSDVITTVVYGLESAAP